MPELVDFDVDDFWFQQSIYWSTLHIISCCGIVAWPPRPWGFAPLVYADKPQTIEAFEENIRLVIADIRPQMLHSVVEYWAFRLEFILFSRGGHFPEIILRT